MGETRYRYGEKDGFRGTKREGKGRRKVKQGEPVIVVGSTKLPGSKTATFDDSNHEDAMTTRPPAPSSTRLPVVALVAALCFVLVTQVCSEAYYGKLIGKLSELHHGVSGEVYAVDSRTLFIKDFTYDGEGPAAYFYAGNSKSPNGNGFRVRDEHGTTNVLKKYRKKGITLSLPDGKNLNNIRWFSVWCDEFSVNFGDVKIPRDFDHPKPQKLAALSGAHGVSSEPVVVVDAQTLLIPSFSYDGEAPDAKFWAGTGPSPSPQGIRIPDENGKERPLRRYNRKTIVLTLPGDLTVHQLGHFGVWCEAFTVDFGHVQIPQGLNVPPSLKMLGVSPQSKLNCEVLEDSLAFEVRWAVAGDSIVVQLVGKLDAGQYMSFGLSAYPNKSVMVGGDVVVAWVDKQTLQGYAIDYFLDAKSQCAGGRGSCPDNRIQENTDSVRLLNAAMVNGYSIVTYQRPLKASDELDLQILTNVSQAIIWAIGPLNERQEVSFHTNYLKTDHFIEFGRPPAWNCPMPDQEQPSPYDNNEKGSVNQELVVTTRRPRRLPATPAPAPKTYAWDIPPIECDEPDDGVFFAQMGPTGGKHGYPAITGHVGWGISWYINGLLIPEINVVRGKTYTFYVEAGEDVETPARYHPFYITDDPIGGYLHKTPEEKAKVKIFAGVRRQRGSVEPTGTGRFCNWVPDPDQPLADEFATFGAYQRTLTLVCEPGEPGLVQWTPDENTPDTVYYQCFTHRYLGWKINVHDTCDRLEPSASENHEVYVKPNGEKPLDDLETGSSIRVPSKVTPTAEFLQQHLHHPHRENVLRYPHHSATNPDKLSAPHTQLLTNANNNHRLQSSSSYENPYGPRPSYSLHAHSATSDLHEVRVNNPHLDVDSSLKRPRQQPIYREQSAGGAGMTTRPPYHGRPQITETDREAQQSSNRQLSNLLADNPRPLNHGMKYPYPPAGSQILYPRPRYHYSGNYHHPHHPLHHHQRYQPEQRTQLMIVRKPVLMRPPLLQTSHSMTIPSFSIPPRTTFLEKKKSIYKHPSMNLRVTSDKAPYGASLQLIKLMKLDTKQTGRLEAKISESSPLDNYGNLLDSIKPARNTGFDPGSIVIEGGFKPIIRNVERRTGMPQRKMLEGSRLEDVLEQDNPTVRSIDNFAPVFVPSPPVSILETGKKLRKKMVTARNAKSRLDEIDDMMMAADRVDAYYLPPTSSGKLGELPSSSSGVLITFDGKKLKDSSLARSISGIEDRPATGLSSDVLSRTPQFGRFKGELPPPIPGEIRPSDSSQSEKRGHPSADLSVPEVPSRKNTKLTLVSRSKRSPIKATISSTDFRGNNTYRIETTGHQHGTIYESDADRNTLTLASTGRAILANLGYIVLATFFYFVV
ncbi:hypothetical protein KM043_007157 [Ampulex compressa]|nr:hypothetical protein KM043_007157 [Ampulex compressa]